MSEQGGLLRRIGVDRTGDELPPTDSQTFLLSPGGMINDPYEAEALGLTVEARRMRGDQERQP